MAQSSIKFMKALSHLIKHNLRIDLPSYLLPKEFQKKNSHWEAEISAKDFFMQEIEKIKGRRGARKAKFENSHWEAVLNLNEEHTLNEVKKVAELIENKFNIKCHNIAIHHDEGHLLHKESGRHLSPSEDYYTDKDGNSFFIENKKRTDKPLNISEYKPIYNYHAHLEFSTYKDKKQNGRQSLTRPHLSQLQTEVAQILKMERRNHAFFFFLLSLVCALVATYLSYYTWLFLGDGNVDFNIGYCMNYVKYIMNLFK